LGETHKKIIVILLYILLPLTAVIALDVAYEQLKSVAEALVNRSEIIFLSSTTGRFDIIAVGQFASTDSLSSFLTDQVAPSEGVKNIETFICLEVKKGRQLPLS